MPSQDHVSYLVSENSEILIMHDQVPMITGEKPRHYRLASGASGFGI